MKKPLTAFTIIVALICTLTACVTDTTSDLSFSSEESAFETMKETSAEGLTEFSGESAYDSYEDALAAYYGYVISKDYDSALSVMMPESVCRLIKYMKSEEEILEEYFYEWDINQKIIFKEVLSEVTMDDAERRQLCDDINAELHCFMQISEKYEQFPPFEELEEEINEMYSQMMNPYNGWILPDSYPRYISDIHKVNVHLTNSRDVDFYHTAVVYLIDNEGWHVIQVEEDPKEEWQKKVGALADMGHHIWSAAADSLNSALAENQFGFAEKDWSQPCVISSDPELCFNFNEEASLAVCGEIIAGVEGAENYDFFIALSANGIDDIIICSKDDHNNICITPSGCICIGDEYENASDLTYEKACQLYLQNMRSQ